MADMYKRIDDLLKERGISGARMSSDLGMSRSFMTELRKGRAKSVKIETAHKIADYFGVSVHYLTGEAETKKSPAEPKLSRGEEEVLELFRQIPEDQQPVVLAMIRAALSSGK